MSWLAILSSLVRLLARLTDHFADRALIRAGEAQAAAAGLAAALRNLEQAKEAENAVADGSGADDDYAKRVRERFRRRDD